MRRARGRRIGGALILFLLALTVVWYRPASPPADAMQRVDAVPLSYQAAGNRLGPFRLTGAWRLDSANSAFNSLSGLEILPDGRFIAVSDRGAQAVFPKPGAAGSVEIDATATGDQRRSIVPDLEAVTVDPETGTRWIAIENLNAIARIRPEDGAASYSLPAEMEKWGANTGPETLLRLANGRFIVISEGRSAGIDNSFPGLLFSHDPLEDPLIRRFHVAMPEGFRPVDATQLADGSVLVLGRRFSLLRGFASVIVIADPAAIRWGGLWRTRELARIDSGPLADNYEGITAESLNGGVRVWLISDDNLARIIQHQYLLRLDCEAPCRDGAGNEAADEPPPS